MELLVLRDIMNSAFIFISAGFTFNTCYVLYKHKMVRGVSLWSQIFFTLWTIWSLYFYGALHQWTSIVGEALLCLAMIIYVSMIIHYIIKEKKNVAINKRTVSEMRDGI